MTQTDAYDGNPQVTPTRSLSDRLKDPALLLIPAFAFLAFMYLLPLIDLMQTSVEGDPWWAEPISRCFRISIYS